MIWHIAKREFTSHLLTWKFYIALVLCVVVGTLGSYVSLKDYELRLWEYNAAVQDEGTRGFSAKLTPNLYRRPEVLSILSQGMVDFDGYFRSRFELSSNQMALNDFLSNS